MKKEQLNEYIGDIVSLQFYDGETAMGKFEFVPCYSAKYGFRHSGFFYIGNCGFKATHVKKLKKIGNLSFSVVEDNFHCG